MLFMKRLLHPITSSPSRPAIRLCGRMFSSPWASASLRRAVEISANGARINPHAHRQSPTFLELQPGTISVDQAGVAHSPQLFAGSIGSRAGLTPNGRLRGGPSATVAGGIRVVVGIGGSLPVYQRRRR